jgi:hypothetical protein
LIVPRPIYIVECDLCKHFKRIHKKPVKGIVLDEIHLEEHPPRVIYLPSNPIGIRICAACLRNLSSIPKKAKQK